MPKIFEIKEQNKIPEEALCLLYSNLNPKNLTKEEIQEKYGNLMGAVKKEDSIWGSVYLDRTYNLFGHIVEIRPTRSAIGCTNYSNDFARPVSEDYKPVVGIIHFTSKDIARSAADKSPLFQVMWSLLKDLDEKKRWICFSGPLPENWAKAMEEKDDETLRKFIEKDRKWEPETRFDKAVWNKILEFLGHGDNAEALHASVEMQEKYHGSILAALGAGLAYQAMGMIDQAIESYHQTVDNWKKAQDADSMPKIKVIYPGVFEHRWRMIGKSIEQSFEETPAAAWALENEGEIYFHRGARDKAIATWQKAVGIFPSSDAALQLARCHLADNQVEKAKAICLDRAQREPRDYHNWILLGRIFSDNEFRREAVDAFNKAYQLNISSPEANYYLGMALVKYAYNEQVEPFHDRQLRFPFDVVPLYERGIFHLRFSIRNSTPPSLAWFLLGMGCLGLDNYSSAVNAFAEYVKQEPLAPCGWNNLALSYSLCGNYDDALLTAQKALNLEPDYSYSHETIGSIHLRKGDIQKALDMLNKAVSLDPRNVEAYCHLAEAYTALGDLQRAKDNYLIARYLAPVNTWKWSIENPAVSGEIIDRRESYAG